MLKGGGACVFVTFQSCIRLKSANQSMPFLLVPNLDVQVLMQMLFANGAESKKSVKKKKKLAKLFKSYPAIGILNVAVNWT